MYRTMQKKRGVRKSDHVKKTDSNNSIDNKIHWEAVIGGQIQQRKSNMFTMHYEEHLLPSAVQWMMQKRMGIEK